jgi:hypothetical protein
MNTQIDGPELNAVPAHVRRAGRMTIWLACVLPLTVYALIVLLSPPDVLDQWPAARRWADSIHRGILSLSSRLDIYKHARSTSFPQVAMLASSLAVGVCLLITLALWVKSTWHVRYTEVFARLNRVTTSQRLGGLLIFPFFGIFCMWAFFCLGEHPRSHYAGFTTQHRAGYLLMSSIAIFFCGIGLGTWPHQVFQIYLAQFPRER